MREYAAEQKPGIIFPILFAIFLHLILLIYLSFFLKLPNRLLKLEKKPKVVMLALNSTSPNSAAKIKATEVKKVKSEPKVKQPERIKPKSKPVIKATTKAISKKVAASKTIKKPKTKSEIKKIQLPSEKKSKIIKEAKSVTKPKTKPKPKPKPKAKPKSRLDNSIAAALNKNKNKLDSRIKKTPTAETETDNNFKPIQASSVDRSKYSSAVKSKVTRQLRWSSRGSDKILRAKLIVRVDSSGNIISVTVAKSSGNGAFDSAAKRAVASASPFPKPPTGVEKERIVFSIRMRE